ncbi:site-2 protease family protein [uncultured Cetobacterium sp.]|uniref:site-2 protease family protein n=1 Tax=uncultured Cetobacterium sp. TaxID=527638 RepID=UPI00262E3C1A|nr:site-2 protease family protein [uncultured Cetobacterium sp.]
MIVLKIIILLFSLVLHELAHGYMAYFCGDKTAKYSGRLSLNPINHLDPAGTLLPILMLLSGSTYVIGWAKPVPVNYGAFRNGRIGEFLVAIAGAMMNYLLMFICVLLIKFNIVQLNPVTIYFIVINMVLGTFNLLPIPPLDGSRVVASFLDGQDRWKVFSMDRYGLFIVIGLSYFGILSRILNPIYSWILRFIDIIIR